MPIHIFYEHYNTFRLTCQVFCAIIIKNILGGFKTNITMKDFRKKYTVNFCEVMNMVEDCDDNLYSDENFKQITTHSVDIDDFLFAVQLCQGIWEFAFFYKWNACKMR